MQGLFTESYMPLADLDIKQQFKNSTPTSYYRDLNISDATSLTKFTIDGTTFSREVFSSAPDQIIVMHITADNPNEVNLVINIHSLLRYKKSFTTENELVIKGKAPAHIDP